MARPKNNALTEVASIDIKPDLGDLGLAPVTIEPAVAGSSGHAMAMVKVKVAALKVSTSAGSLRQHWRTYLPEHEANALIAEGKVELCP
jgi:hypothetical protein